MSQLSILEAARREQLCISEAGPECDRQLSQWFTPPHIAEAIAGIGRDIIALENRPSRILEPSAGRGNLIRAFQGDRMQFDAVDLDERWRADLESLGARVHIGSYIERPPPEELYDLALTNPPFDGGEEGAHLAKMMDECLAIAGMLPARSFHGAERYRLIWSRMGRDWWMRRIVHCIARPKFSDAGGTDEIVLFGISREPGPCSVRWV